MIFQKPMVRAPVEPPGLQRSVALSRVPQHYFNPNPKIARPPPPTPPSPLVSFPALSNPVRVLPLQEAVGPRIRTPEVFPKLHPTHREVPALAVGGEHSVAPVSPRTRFQPNVAANRTTDRAGRARAPGPAHPVFDDKNSTPTHPARGKKAKCDIGRPVH